MPEPASPDTYWDADTPGSQPSDLRQCGRCRQRFAADPTLHPVAKPEWWLCQPCHDALFDKGGRKGEPKVAR